MSTFDPIETMQVRKESLQVVVNITMVLLVLKLLVWLID